MSVTTWNPEDKSANISLSEGNLKATATSTAHKSVRANVSRDSGKWYFEVNIVSGSASNGYIIVGVGTSAAAISSYMCSNAYGWAFDSGGRKGTNGSFSAYGASFQTGDVLGVALDLDGGTLKFAKNNTWYANAFTGLSGSMYPMASVYANTQAVKANFGATDLTYSPPEGYTKWMGETATSVEDVRLYLSTLGTGIEDLLLYLSSISGDQVEALELYLASVAEDRENVRTYLASACVLVQSLPLYLSTTDADVREALRLLLATTDGIVLESVRLYLSAIKQPPSFRSVVAQRLNSILSSAV